MFKSGGSYTLIIARSGREGARTYSLPVLLTTVIGLLGGVLFLSFLFSMLHYWWMAERTHHVLELETEVARMRQENAGLRAISGKLTDKISSLEVTATRLKFLSEDDEDGFGGAGGPARVARPLLTLDHGDLLKRFRTLDGRRMTLESELRRLQDYYTTRSILQSALPTLMPVRGYPSDGYGYRRDPFTGEREFHPGVDISAPRGAKVVATSDGEVTQAGWHHGYGRLVSLRHRFGIVTGTSVPRAAPPAFISTTRFNSAAVPWTPSASSDTNSGSSAVIFFAARFGESSPRLRPVFPVAHLPFPREDG